MAPHKTSYKPSVRDFLFSVRLLSLFFASIAFFQFIYQQAGEAHGTYFYLLYAPLAVCGVCIAVFLCISNVYRAAGRYARQLKVLECVLMSAIFLCAIAVTGLYQSQYKILFLFLIISYTFEYGMRAGLYLAVFASLSIVGIDLVWAPVKGGVNLYFQNDLLLCGAFIVTAWALGFYAQMRQEHIASLERQINTDGLTGLLNHRNFYDVVQLCYDTAQKEGTPLSLIFADIDYFTTYNDCHGHQQGDLALKETADLLASTAGQKGQLFRYSGAKFDPEAVELYFESEAGRILIYKDGQAADYSEEEATKILSCPAVTVVADMKMGEAQATAWGCDLTYDYVKINADYRS